LKNNTEYQSRNISAGGKEIPYLLRSSKKARHLRLQIVNNQLEVILPKRVTKKEAEKFILEKFGWIQKHLKEKKPKKFLYNGKEIQLNQSFDLFMKEHQFLFRNNKLDIISPINGDSEISKTYDFWLREKAAEYLPGRTEILARKNNFQIKKVVIRGQKTRWGSCSTSGTISFNFQLMQFDKKIIDYVIIHELCHTKEMNHSKGFWMLVEQYCPNFKECKKQIKNQGMI